MLLKSELICSLTHLPFSTNGISGNCVATQFAGTGCLVETTTCRQSSCSLLIKASRR